jgi:hypothetical protein
MKLLMSLLLFLASTAALATPYGVVTANALWTMDLSKQYAFPAVSDTFCGLTATQTLSNKTFTAPHFDVLQMAQQATPSDPPSGSDKLYFKVDDNLYALNSAGTEIKVNGGGGGGGSSGLSVSTVAASASLIVGSPVNYQHVACNAASAAVVLTIPLCSGNVGQVFNVKKIDSSTNTCTLLFSGSDVGDGHASLTITAQYNSFDVVCRAAGFWDIL